MKRLGLLFSILLLSVAAPATVGSWTLYYSDTSTVNGDGSVTVTPTVSISGNDGGWCNGDTWACWGFETAAVMMNGNAWAIGPDLPAGQGLIAFSYTFPSVTLPANGSTVDMSYGAKVAGEDWLIGNSGWLPGQYLWYNSLFEEGIAPPSNVPPNPGWSPCWIISGFTPACPLPWPPLYPPQRGMGRADLGSQQVAQTTLGYTPVQHNYPRNPLPQICRITAFFDATRATGPHHADDVVYDNNGRSQAPPLGAPVYAMEAGKVVEAVSGQPSAPYPACLSTVPRPPGNHVKIQADVDNYVTLYFHMTPSVAVNDRVTAGQQIGVLDSSGCQSAPHLHVSRKDPNGNLVNFTIPCVNPLPTTKYDDGTINDNVPD